ncbi:BTB/POZ fold [Artemisia annua]|uniref:BTB/POZ fold n=1 Tax=Artemisia annua TaxID=35608 RepID=A0A2U1LQ00_ARTAN|nr:BTB/POZ fold [Artemisia annua]
MGQISVEKKKQSVDFLTDFTTLSLNINLVIDYGNLVVSGHWREKTKVTGDDPGGKNFCTTDDTLTQREPHSMLAAMFSGRHTVCKDIDKGYVFLDRDGKHFRHITVMDKLMLVGESTGHLYMGTEIKLGTEVNRSNSHRKEEIN